MSGIITHKGSIMKRSEVDKKKLSPMMLQWMETKDKYPNDLIFFRLGDFYELFFEDAELASRELELTLTGKVAGLEERVPMCGVPHHAVKQYIEKLVNNGHKVVIVEQLEDPRKTTGMVKRGVTSVISRGTIADYELLDEHSESLIASLIEFNDIFILTTLDISTGKLSSIKLDKNYENLISEINNLGIKEIVMMENLNSELIDLLRNNYNIDLDFSDSLIDEEKINWLEESLDARIKMGIKHLFYYLTIDQLKDLSHVDGVNIVNKSQFLEMDVHTVRNLELLETIRLKDRTYSLIWLLDKCKTAMGSRKLKSWLMNPLKDISLLNDRYDKLEKLNTEFIIRDELKDYLYEIYDLERLTGKLTNGSLNAKDLLQLKNSLKVLPNIKEAIRKLGFSYVINEHSDIYDLLEKAISPDAPFALKEGGIFKSGYNSELDELKSIRSGGKDFVANFEKQIKEQTGIKTLKIGYNKVFGYYIEVSKGQISEIKPEYGFERRQTLANAERYISPELKEKESLILNAEEKIIDLEYELFIEIKEIIRKQINDIKLTADTISEIDALVSLAIVADQYNFIRPQLNNNHIFDIKEGRHPVVEEVMRSEYVPNDCYMDSSSSTLLITGPNMSGKSTYMRQNAIIVIMAQMGSFVPAKKANLPIIDKIFTRIGASDDLVSGESTFMVEMKEAKRAIVNATQDSLILFDELGRGTATYDGMALARAILEFVTKNIRCYTLFSTHYHELTELEHQYSSISNIHVSAIEDGDKLTFLHKVHKGAVDKSYGIHVAKLAGLPKELLDRANEILISYETSNKKKPKNSSLQMQLVLEEPVKDDKLYELISELDPLNTTPMDALNKLIEIKDLYDKEKKC
jgi:DNA mismatch repair protein MutS